jgi:hypothetical protein
VVAFGPPTLPALLKAVDCLVQQPPVDVTILFQVKSAQLMHRPGPEQACLVIHEGAELSFGNVPVTKAAAIAMWYDRLLANTGLEQRCQMGSDKQSMAASWSPELSRTWRGGL